MVQHQHDHRRIDRRILERQRQQFSLDEANVVSIPQSLPTRLQHGGFAIDRDDLADHRSESFRGITGTAAEVGHHPVRIKEAKHGLRSEPGAEQLLTHFVPLATHTPEESLRVGSTTGQDLAQTGVVVRETRSAGDPIAGRLPEPTQIGIQSLRQQTVETGRAFAPLHDPAMLMKSLEMTAHRGLRELGRSGQFSDSELGLFDQSKQANPRDITKLGKDRQPLGRTFLASVFTGGLRHANHKGDQEPGGSTSVGPGISP